MRVANLIGSSLERVKVNALAHKKMGLAHLALYRTPWASAPSSDGKCNSPFSPSHIYLVKPGDCGSGH